MKQHEGYTAPGRARAQYLWMAPTKVRRVLPHLKQKSVQDAIDILQHVSHRSSVQLQKLIKSAHANYMQKFPQADPSTLYLKNLYVDEGPRVKRIWRRGRGRADVLLKRMCHITALVEASTSTVLSSRSKRNTTTAPQVVSKSMPSSVAGALLPNRKALSSKQSVSSSAEQVSSKVEQANAKKSTSTTSTEPATVSMKLSTSKSGTSNTDSKESPS